MELLIVSQNSAKIQELRLFLKELLGDVHVRSLLEFPDVVIPEELEDSFAGNAQKKAQWAQQLFSMPCLCDNSGLIVPFLGDETESFRRKKERLPQMKLPDTKRLLRDLSGADDGSRSATLESYIALAVAGQEVKIVSARMEGSIAHQEKGPSSFDFASVFIKDGYSKTLAELPSSVLARISHRRRCCEKLHAQLRAIR